MCILTIALDQHPIYKAIICINRDDAISWNLEDSDSDFDDLGEYGLGAAGDIVAAKEFSLISNWVGVRRESALFSGYIHYNETDDELAPFHPDYRKSKLIDSLLAHSQVEHEEVVEKLIANRKRYPGFNLVTGNLLTHKFKLISSHRDQESFEMDFDNGMAVVTNGPIEDQWPKAGYAMDKMRSILRSNLGTMEPSLFADQLLMDKENFWKSLDDQSISEENEFDFNSPIFVSPSRRDEETMYATVSSTVILVEESGHTTYFERTYEHNSSDPDDIKHEDNVLTFDL